MKEWINELRNVQCNLNVIICILEGGFKSIESSQEDLLRDRIDCYTSMPNKLQHSIDSIIREFGDVKIKDL